MSSYISPQYIFLFLPIVIILYNFLPKKVRPILLLIASYIFFLLVSGKLIVFLILSTLSIYIAGRAMQKLDLKKEEECHNLEKEERKIVKEKYKRKKKRILIFTVFFNVAFLFFFKYLNFFKNITNSILESFRSNFTFKLIKHAAPIGISFYTLQAISYLIDVYNEKIEADKKFLRLSLYLSFFPTIMEGPITRYNDVSESLYSGEKVTYKNLCFGLQRIFFGILKKLVIADRLNAYVKIIFADYMYYSGVSVALGAIFYTILLYMEFSGTMDLVIGSAEIFNIKLPENFRQPFFSKNISEFWSRWHITLGTWFKDYIFYPVSLSKPVKKVTSFLKNKVGNRVASLVMGAIALFAVWSLNGLWHGAGFTFILYGYYHFTLILLGNIFEPIIAKGCEKIKINRHNKIYKGLQIFKTWILIFIGELIFRAPSLKVAFGMLKQIFTNFSIKGFLSEYCHLGLDIKDYLILLIVLIIMFIISILKEKGLNIREKIASKNIVIRWCLYYALLLGIIIFGAYGPGYAPVDPIYADF